MSKGQWKNYKSEDNHKRTQQCVFRATRAEKERLFELAAAQDLTLSEYILARSLYVDNSDVIALKGEACDLVRELVKVDINFNQATKNINICVRLAQDGATFSREKLENALAIIEEEQELRHNIMRRIGILLNNMKRF